MLSGQSQFAILCKEYISGKLTKSFSQFRLHFRLCLGSFMGWCSSRAYFHKLYDAVLRPHMKLHLALSECLTPTWAFIVLPPLCCTTGDGATPCSPCSPTHYVRGGTGACPGRLGQRFLLLIFCKLISTSFNAELGSA